MRGYFGIGIENTKTKVNIGTLWRSAKIFGASFVFTTGRRYQKQASDTLKAWRHVPLFHYDDIADLKKHIPYNCLVIGVEIDSQAIWLPQFVHPERAIYLLGAEDSGLSKSALNICNAIIKIEGEYCLNVAVAGSIVMYDRSVKH